MTRGELASETLRRTRYVVISAVSAVLLATAAIALLPASSRWAGLAPPAMLVGLVSPVIGYRLYLWQRERAASREGMKERCRAYFRATVTSLAAAEVSMRSRSRTSRTVPYDEMAALRTI